MKTSTLTQQSINTIQPTTRLYIRRWEGWLNEGLTSLFVGYFYDLDDALDLVPFLLVPFPIIKAVVVIFAIAWMVVLVGFVVVGWFSANEITSM